MTGRGVPLRAGFASIAACLATAIGVNTQPSDRPRFSTSTAAVAVDVVVRDRNGRPVTGLTQADFQVFEDGNPQTIKTFDVIEATGRTPLATDLPPTVEAATASTGRVVVGGVAALVFEELGAESRRLATRAATRFVREELRDSDRAAVCVVGRALSTLADLTSDKATLLAAIDRAVLIPGRPMVQAGSVAGAEFGDASTVHESPFFRAHSTLSSLQALVEMMGRYPGRKVIVVFSEGLAFGADREVGTGDTWLHDNRRNRFLSLLARANRAHVAFYTFDAAGLRAQSPSEAARMGGMFGAEPYIALRMLADETGGRFVDSTNDLLPGLRRVAEDLRHYYLLGYTSTNPAADGSERQLRVKVTRRGVTVTHRRSYWAPSSR